MTDQPEQPRWHWSGPMQLYSRLGSENIERVDAGQFERMYADLEAEVTRLRQENAAYLNCGAEMKLVLTRDLNALEARAGLATELGEMLEGVLRTEGSQFRQSDDAWTIFRGGARAALARLREAEVQG